MHARAENRVSALGENQARVRSNLSLISRERLQGRSDATNGDELTMATIAEVAINLELSGIPSITRTVVSFLFCTGKYHNKTRQQTDPHRFGATDECARGCLCV